MGLTTETGTFQRIRELNPVWYAVLAIFSIVILTLSILNVFMLHPFGVVFLQSSYLFTLIAFSLPLVFLLYPARSSNANGFPWYDYLLFFLSFGTALYFAYMGGTITDKGWELRAPMLPTILSVALWLMILESVRRTSGMPLFIVCTFFSFYPLFCGGLPGLLKGRDFSFPATAAFHIMSNVSMLGIPMQALGNILIGFLIFGVVLQATGGGEAFFNMAMALMGKYRGGPAKVSVFSSSLYGTMSGSVISNVLIDGPYTIPAMVKCGYKPHFAGAIEAVTSTGGALMPPVMGAVAFVMANLLNVPYSSVCVAAAVPAILYYFGLFIQIDAYAAKNGLQGLPSSDLPRLKKAVLQSWAFLLALLVLIFTVFRDEGTAPFYTMTVLILCSMVKRETRLSLKAFLRMVADSGKVIAEIITIMAGIGFVVGTFSMTGVGAALSGELTSLAGNNAYLLLILGAMASFILGMGMTATACYLFLAITLAPAVVSMGYNLMAVHLFLLYWGLVSFITPPVALGAIAAASVAKTSSMKVGYAAMRLGAVMYFVPFYFVLNPSLILIGSPLDIVFSVVTAFIGVYFIANALEGYMIGLGEIGIVIRILMVILGLLICAPYRVTELVGFSGLIPILIYVYYQRKKAKQVKKDGLDTAIS